MEMSAIDLISAINEHKRSGSFGWSEDNEHMKGIIFTDGDFSLLACAGGNYVTIAVSQDSEKSWITLASHDSTWRAGVEQALSEKKAINAEMKKALVELNGDDSIYEIIIV